MDPDHRLGRVGPLRPGPSPHAAGRVVPGLRELARGADLNPSDLARVGGLTASVRADDGDPRWVDHWAHLLGPAAQWPPAPLIVTAIDLATGTRACFSRTCETSLAQAVAASTDIPLVAHPVTINGRRYGDGATASQTNADLATGHDRVLILAPTQSHAVATEVAALEARGTRTTVLHPGTSASVLATGVNTLDPRRIANSAHVGLDDGTRFAHQHGDGLLKR